MNHTQDLVRQNGAPPPAIVEQVIVQGDLSKLLPEERANYYLRVCESLGLNPLTKPFEYLTLNSRMVLYARKDCTDQLRMLRKVSLAITGREFLNDLYVVTAKATLPDGRCDEEIGAVSVKGLAGEFLANAMMKASTKAKRRVTLSVCGLGMLDETETDSIPGAVRVEVDHPPLPALERERQDWESIPDETPGAPAGPDSSGAPVRSELAGQPAHDNTTGEPPWARTPLGRQVMALADALTDAGKKFALPADDADEQALRGWLASKKTLLAPAAK